MMNAQQIIDRVGRLAFDPTHVRWTVEEIRSYIHDAMMQICLLLPDAYSETFPYKLTAGTKQTLPAGSIRLLRIIRNMGATGTTPGKAIYPTDRAALDAEQRNWHSVTGTGEVDHYVYDPKADRLTFYAFPAATSNTWVELVVSKAPAMPSGDSAELPLTDQYINPIVDWVLGRCWAKDADYAGNMPRSQGHHQAFYAQLGIKFEAAEVVDPNQRVRPSTNRPG